MLSKAGRDAGRRFIVLRVEEPFCYIADGDLRKAEKPKKKKILHLHALPDFYSAIAEAIGRGEMPMDAQLRRYLADRP